MPRKVIRQATAAAPRAIPGSTIDRTMPEQGNATTDSVRTNFGIAADEIEALQGEVERIDTESATETTRVNTAIAAETTRTDTQFTTEQTRVNTQFTTEQTRVNTALDAKAMRAGDLGGTVASTTVLQLQGRPVANTAPGTGQVLAWSAGNQWEPTTAGAGITDAPTDGTGYARKDGGWVSTVVVYKCVGIDDDVAIKALVGAFFADTTKRRMELIITGVMGLTTGAPVGNIYFDLDFVNGRNAWVTLDFSDCTVPTPAPNTTFMRLAGAVNVRITGLVAIFDYPVASTGGVSYVIQNDATGQVYIDNCHIRTSAGGGPYTNPNGIYNTRTMVITNCRIDVGSGGSAPKAVYNASANGWLWISDSHLTTSAANGGWCIDNDATCLARGVRMYTSNGGAGYCFRNNTTTAIAALNGCHMDFAGSSGFGIFQVAGRIMASDCYITFGSAGGGGNITVQDGRAVFSNIHALCGNSTGNVVNISGGVSISMTNCFCTNSNAGLGVLFNVTSAFTGTIKLSNCRFVTTGGNAIQVSAGGTPLNFIIHGCEVGSGTNDIFQGNTIACYWNVVGNVFSKAGITLQNGTAASFTDATRYVPANANRFSQTVNV